MGIPAIAGLAASGAPPAHDLANSVLTGTFLGVGPGRAFPFQGPMNVVAWGVAATSLTTTQGSLAASVVSGAGQAAGVAINSVDVAAGTTWATFSGTTGTLALPTYTYYGRISVNLSQITGLYTTAGLLGAVVTGPGIPAGTTVTSIVLTGIPATSTVREQKGTVGLSQPATFGATVNQDSPFAFALTSQAITTGTDALATFTGAGIGFSATLNIERSFDGGYTWLLCNIGGTGTLAQYTAGTTVSITFGEPEKGVLYRLNCIAYTSGLINYRISATGGAATSLAIGSPI